MKVTKAIILAAGVGSRLRPMTDTLPKCLLEVGGRSLIDHQVAALRSLGITDLVVVVGHQGDKVREHLNGGARYLENTRYELTNSLYSLWLAREELRSGALVFNSDVLVPSLLIDRLLRSPAPDAILAERGERFEAEDMKVMLNGSAVVDFGKDLPADRSHAHNVGIAKFSAQGGWRLAACLEALVATGHENDWTPVAYGDFGHQWPLVAVFTDGLPWIEIDYPGDLARARTEVEPAIGALDGVPVK